MKTITLQKPGSFVLSDTPEPGAPGAAEALVGVKRIGICGTDLHAFRGRQPFFTYPRILGHELGVEILEIGPNDRGLKVGDKCSVEPYMNCGQCSACRRGKPNCCLNLKVLGVHTDGGMRDRIVVPAVKLHKSNSLELEQLALVETLGIGSHAVSRAQVQEGEAVLVIGAGPIGLSVTQFVQAAGGRVIMMDMNENRLQFCRQAMGVKDCITAGEGALAALRDLLGGDLPTAVFDATGNPQSMMGSFQYAINGGRVIFVGLFQGDVTFHDPDFHRKELTLLSTRNATAADFTKIIGMMEKGQINTTPWITHRAAAEEMVEVFPSWLDPANGVIKAMVAF